LQVATHPLKALREKHWDSTEILVLYIDGQRFGAHHILSAVGVDSEGRKHILGIEAGETENAARGEAAADALA
jgi:transposase-like protein